MARARPLVRLGVVLGRCPVIALLVGSVVAGTATAAVLRLAVSDGGDRVLTVCIVGTLAIVLSSWSLGAVACVSLSVGTALVLSVWTMGVGDGR